MGILTNIFTVIVTSPIFLFFHCLKNKLFLKSCTSKGKLNGKTAIITGASAGIGKETAIDFAKRGARLILACRNLEKSQKVADSIISQTGNKNVIVMKLDTSDLQSVRNFAKEVLKNESKIDILVNNAGIAGNAERILTKDGLEQTMATNYFGHFLLTNLLIDRLKQNTSSRIINVSSIMHRIVFGLDPDNLNFDNITCTRALTYSQSKLCQILFTLELSQKLKGTGVTVNSLHPGVVATSIYINKESWLMMYLDLMAYFLGISEPAGAQTTIYAAVDEGLKNVSGKYFDNCEEGYQSGLSMNKDLAKKLWKSSVRDVRLRPNEIVL